MIVAIHLLCIDIQRFKPQHKSRALHQRVKEPENRSANIALEQLLPTFPALRNIMTVRDVIMQVVYTFMCWKPVINVSRSAPAKDSPGWPAAGDVSVTDLPCVHEIYMEDHRTQTANSCKKLMVSV